jgi:hypothetical protein
MGKKKAAANPSKPQPLGFRLYAAAQALDSLDYDGASRARRPPPTELGPSARLLHPLMPPPAGCPGQVSSVSEKEVAVKLVG